MQTLGFLIEKLTQNRNIHISVHDLTGVLNTRHTYLEFKNTIHSKKFCDIAKSTDRGYRACLECKRFANTRAITERMPFFGSCIYGISEAAYPVIIGGSVAAIVYVGNAVTDVDETKRQIHRICGYTSAPERDLFDRLHFCERISDFRELLSIAELVADYLKLLYRIAPEDNGREHWLVRVMKRYAEERYSQSISLREISITYSRNEKYIGRLFKSTVGKSFGEYLSDIRLSKAEEFLLSTDKSIIDIALECGFNSLSYFNRAFKDRYSVCPREYRRKKGASLK